MSKTTHRAWFGAGWCVALTFDAILDGKSGLLLLGYLALASAQFWIASHVSKTEAT